MPNVTDADYLKSRARQERDLASSSEDNCAALAHLKMAEEYERRLRLAIIDAD